MFRICQCFFVIFANHINKFQKPFFSCWDFIYTGFDFYQRISSIRKLIHRISFQTAVIAVMQHICIMDLGIYQQIPYDHILKHMTEKSQIIMEICFSSLSFYNFRLFCFMFFVIDFG